MSEPETKSRQKNEPRLLSVVSKESISPNMVRITLGGSDMVGFPEGRESANFKLRLPEPGETKLALSNSADNQNPAKKPSIRTYTVRNHDAKSNLVDVDFVLHDDHGAASYWAINAQLGDEVGFMGPGSAKLADMTADWFLFAGDMSALPAIGANIEKLPNDAQGYAVLEIIDAEDRQDLLFPERMEVHWVINSTPNTQSTLLYDKVKSLPLLTGTPSIWVAGESGSSRLLRRYFRQECSVERSQLYASGYWQIGLTEDRHQIVKRENNEQ